MKDKIFLNKNIKNKNDKKLYKIPKSERIQRKTKIKNHQ